MPRGQHRRPQQFFWKRFIGSEWIAVKAQFPCIFARVIETPWYTGDWRATSCLSCSATLSKQFPRFHSNYTANVVFQGQDMHAFFIDHHEQARNECKSFRRYRSSWLKKYTWVSRGIELPYCYYYLRVQNFAILGFRWFCGINFCDFTKSR